MIYKYNFIDASGNILARGDDNTITFGGPWGVQDSNGYPKWVENVISLEQQKNEQITQLNSEYEVYMNDLAVNYAKALAQGNAVGAADIAAEMVDVKVQYQADLDAIQNP